MPDRFCVEFYDGEQLLGAVDFPIKRGKAAAVAAVLCETWKLPFVTAVYYKPDGSEVTRKKLPVEQKGGAYDSEH